MRFDLVRAAICDFTWDDMFSSGGFAWDWFLAPGTGSLRSSAHPCSPCHTTWLRVGSLHRTSDFAHCVRWSQVRAQSQNKKRRAQKDSSFLGSGDWVWHGSRFSVQAPARSNLYEPATYARILRAGRTPKTSLGANKNTHLSMSDFIWLRLVETLRTSSEQYEDYEFDDLAATVRLYEPSLAFSFDNL